MEDIVDNTFAMTDYLEELVRLSGLAAFNTDLQVRDHPGFRLVPEYSTRQCTNLGFWYIPERCTKKKNIWCCKFHAKLRWYRISLILVCTQIEREN